MKSTSRLRGVMRRAKATSAVIALSIAGAGLGTSDAANAQTVDAPSDQPERTSAEAGVPVIVVTAERSEESVQDVPVAITAFDQASLREFGFQDAKAVASQVPNLVFSTGSYESIPKITLRGVGTADFTQNVATAVGVYVDDVYQGLAPGINAQLFDTQRVEVLRGPQGTLYGKNTIGGAINYIPNLPSFDLEGGATLTIAERNTFETQGFINVPLDDQVAVRFSMSTRDSDGYVENIFRNETENEIDQFAFRAQLLYEVTPELTFRLSADRSVNDSGLPHSTARGRLPSGVDLAGYRAPEDIYIGTTNEEIVENIKTWGLLGRFDWSIGDVTVTSISAFDSVTRDAIEDPSQSFNDIVVFNWLSDQEAYSQELRVQGEGTSLEWLVGAHYYLDKHDVENRSSFFGCFAAGTCQTPDNFADQSVLAAVFGLPPAGVGGFPIDPDAYTGAVRPITTGIYASLATDVIHQYEQENESLALFGQATYSITDALSLTAGLRYTYEERAIAASSTFSNPMSFNTGYPLFVGERDWDNLSGKATLEYRPTDTVLLFGTISRGFRAGNWNGAAFFDPEEVEQPVDPETVTNYEIGIKSELFDGKIFANATVFRMDFQDKQEFIFRDGQIFLENAAEATSQGVELELLFAPTSRLTGTLGVGYLDTEYGEFNAVLQSENNTGNRLPNSPEWTLNGSLNYAVPLNDTWEFKVGGDFRYIDDVFFQANNDPVVAADANTVVNLRAGFTSDDFDVTFFAENAFDEEYFVDGNDIGVPFFWSILTQGRPRTLGVRLDAVF